MEIQKETTDGLVHAPHVWFSKAPNAPPFAISDMQLTVYPEATKVCYHEEGCTSTVYICIYRSTLEAQRLLCMEYHGATRLLSMSPSASFQQLPLHRMSSKKLSSYAKKSSFQLLCMTYTEEANKPM
ncbi:hypothetical protein Dimus_037435, partial [Dionaea muscipula]